MNNNKPYKPANIKNNNMYPGDPQGSPDESFSLDTLVFIDSAFLEKLSKHLGKGKYLKFDRFSFLVKLAEKQKLNCEAIFYYIASPFQGYNPTPEEEKRRNGYDRFIGKLKENRIIIREGRCQKVKCEDDFVYKQKAVDVLLAMDLTNIPLKYPKIKKTMCHPHLKVWVCCRHLFLGCSEIKTSYHPHLKRCGLISDIKKIIFVSSDSDFVPVIENLEKNGVKTILYTYYEKIRNTPFSVSNHLIKSVHKYVLLIKSDFDNAPLNKGELK